MFVGNWAWKYSLIHYVAPKQAEHFCGTLVKNEYQFFYLSPFNPANVVIQNAQQTISFRSEPLKSDIDMSTLQLNQPICVSYIDAEKSIFVLNNFIVSVNQK
ncbi:MULTISPECIES: hypothetical protein [unclassified Acinetobacter]|uniref:hypothetical protein n=1 Tax=unclassified Acinetobacter TaxID=196816 RepID=UPI0035B77D87